jgi:hypothetical protein
MKSFSLFFLGYAVADQLFEVAQENLIQPVPESDTIYELTSCSSDMDLIKLSEGLNKCMYHDTLGIPTVCYGYNLQNRDANEKVS